MLLSFKFTSIVQILGTENEASKALLLNLASMYRYKKDWNLVNGVYKTSGFQLINQQF
jgi:hypothetical protein